MNRYNITAATEHLGDSAWLVIDEHRDGDWVKAEDAADWQPIETAPKDGRSIIGCGADDGTDHQYATSMIWHCGRWFTWLSDQHFQWRPTRWMPMPERPETERNET